MGNGFAMAAILGRKEIMNTTTDSFISSTYWTERIGPAAALASIKKMKENNVHEHLVAAGKYVQELWQSAAKKNDIQIKITGIYPLSRFYFQEDNDQALRVKFTEIMLEKGFLATNIFYPSFAHKSIHLEQYGEALHNAFYQLTQIDP